MIGSSLTRRKGVRGGWGMNDGNRDRDRQTWTFAILKLCTVAIWTTVRPVYVIKHTHTHIYIYETRAMPVCLSVLLSRILAWTNDKLRMTALIKPCSCYWWRNPLLFVLQRTTTGASPFSHKGGWFQLIESSSPPPQTKISSLYRITTKHRKHRSVFSPVALDHNYDVHFNTPGPGKGKNLSATINSAPALWP
jgi:hypothetical protein